MVVIFKKAAFLSLALIGENNEFIEELIKTFLLNDEGEEKKETDTDANIEVSVSPTPKDEQDKLDEQTEGINYIYHFYGIKDFIRNTLELINYMVDN